MDRYPAILAVGVVAVVVLSTQLMGKQSVQANLELASSTGTVQLNNTQTILGYESAYGSLPKSLEGTLMKQALMVDANGDLIVTPDLKRIFNYFLSINQEESLEVILLRIQEYLEFYLEGDALAQAEHILDGYIAYKKALMDFEQEQNMLTSSSKFSGGQYGIERLTSMEELLLKRRALRQEFLSPEAIGAFYDREDRYDDYMLEKLKINARSDIGAEEKASLLSSLDSTADPDWIASRKQATLAVDVREATDALIEQGANAEEVRAMRIEMAGIEATNRLEALDEQRALWQSRVDDYMDERESIMNQSGLEETEKLQQVSDLRSDRFTQREQLRVRTYERQANL